MRKSISVASPPTYSPSQHRLVYLVHLLIWGILFLMPFLFMQVNNLHNPRFTILLFLTQATMAIIFYTNYLFLAPKLLLVRKTFLYILSVVSLLTTMYLFRQLVWEAFDVKNLLREEFGYVQIKSLPNPEMFMPIVSGVLVVAIGTTLRALQHSHMHEKLGDVIRESKLNAELAFLKNQISPHFFFNTLNTIYALTGKDPKAAQDALHKLSKLMRYLLYETEKPLTTLQSEIDFLEDYIELMKMRLPSHVNLQFEHQIDQGQSKIPPMLLIPLVENAFKHGISNQQACSLHFSMTTQMDTLHFSTRNPIHIRPHSKEPGGVGLSNMKRRLDILYKQEDYSFQIQKESETFSVNLSVPTYAN